MAAATRRVLGEEHRAVVRAERSLLHDRLAAQVALQVNRDLPAGVEQRVEHAVSRRAGHPGRPTPRYGR